MNFASAPPFPLRDFSLLPVINFRSAVSIKLFLTSSLFQSAVSTQLSFTSLFLQSAVSFSLYLFLHTLCKLLRHQKAIILSCLTCTPCHHRNLFVLQTVTPVVMMLSRMHTHNAPQFNLMFILVGCNTAVTVPKKSLIPTEH